MPSFTTTDLNRKSGDLLAAAAREPVVITQRRKPRFVLLSIEDYNAMRGREDTRKAGTLGDMSPELLAAVEQAIDQYEAEGDDP